MSDPSRVRVTGPLEAYAAGFRAELTQLGYTEHSTSYQLQLLAHLSRWLGAEGLDASGLMPAVMEQFLAARRAASYHMWLSPKALAPLLQYLRSLRVAPPAPVAVLSPIEDMLMRYRTYLTSERGLTASTARGYADMVGPFLRARERPDGAVELQTLAARDVTAFVLADVVRRGRGSAKLAVTALRSILGFLHVEGISANALASAVPSVAGWRLAGLPKALDPEQASQLLASCDRATTIGRRDFAVLTMLVRLGLRAGEVAALRLDEIDWRRGEIVVRGKGNCQEPLPLPVDIGGAIVAYLQGGRPAVSCRYVFLRVHAPHRQLTTGAVSHIVRGAARRAGLPPMGAHRLRHTAATEMLRAGAPLSEIGQVLRHRSPLSTAIYAKVDREALRTLARPWPARSIA